MVESVSQQPAKAEQRQGLFVSFEGGEGSGKSTQAQRLWERLRDTGILAVLVREPGTTALGWAVRDLVKSREGLSPAAELALFAAARAELVDKVLKPEMERGAIVVADRYMDSTVAYQGYGRGLPLDAIRSLNALVTQGILPNRTFLLDQDPQAGLGRLGVVRVALQGRGGGGDAGSGGGRLDQEGHRRFEEEPLAFHRRVRQGYLALAKEEAQRFLVLDATKPPDDLADAIWQEVQRLLAEVQGRQSAPRRRQRRPPASEPLAS